MATKSYWSTLSHEGPSVPTILNKTHVVGSDHDYDREDTSTIICNKNKVIRLNATQTYLLCIYYNRYHLKVDNLFQHNFWASIRIVGLKKDSDIMQFKKPNKPIEMTHTAMSVVYLDGKKVSTAGHIDGPSIFCGRDSKHPKRGTCKWGVHPRDVTLNMSTNVDKSVVRKKGFIKFVELKHVNWIASWKDHVTDETRYITIKQTETLEKFNQARMLKAKLPKLHDFINQNIQSNNHKKQQLALAIYIIEHLCIRVGNEKDTIQEADTVGCCTLRAHTHIRINNTPLRTVNISFIGKDSIPFKKNCILPPLYFKVASNMLNAKKTDILFFDLVSPTTINRALQKIVPLCTAKTFRTMKASLLFERTLLNTSDPSMANRKVAQLLNHRRLNNTKYNMETSRNNYIDPRIYYAFCDNTKQTPKPGWFLNTKENDSQTDSSFKF
jgi:DNA topoisomerase IB